MSAASRNHNFDPGAYLDAREHDPNFVMVEIGHGAYPVAHKQPGGWTGERRYIGIEAGLRDPDGMDQAIVRRLHAEHPGQNVTYMEQQLSRFVSFRRGIFYSARRAFYRGPYDPRTALGDGIANEVFLSDVIGDPHLAHSNRRVPRLLAEIGRITANGGVVVIRERQTPRFAFRYLTPKFLEPVGLQAAGPIYSHRDPLWEQLETLYGNAAPYAQACAPSLYRFLTKTATTTN